MNDDDLKFLAAVLDYVGGPTNLADAIGIGTSRVANWTYRQAVPDSWAMVLRLKYGNLIELKAPAQVVAQSQ